MWLLIVLTLGGSDGFMTSMEFNNEPTCVAAKQQLSPYTRYVSFCVKK